MEITTKELESNPVKIIDRVINGESVIIILRGRAMARIVPFDNNTYFYNDENNTIFGMWKDHNEEKTVEESVRELRKGRQF
ncbi:MAG: type II toxin-antitoxin system prevent-host-death family antitoxin [Desulfamplus sp.]|nr:type II toxin-antitoxin system prevent-host-death family antitoxin [Desulfamplus sp.]